MTEPFRRLTDAFPWLRQRPTLMKAISFALIGLFNAVVDTSVFFLTWLSLHASAAAERASAVLAAACACAAADTPILVAANVVAWMVAVTGSYVLNTSITFAAESGRALRLSDYWRFAASGLAGLVASTATLIAAYALLPIWVAKAAAILVGFAVNFSLSHFVVFRPKRPD